MDGGHHTLLNAQHVVDALKEGGKTVSGARGARYLVGLASVLLGINTHDNGQRVILGGGGRENDLPSRQHQRGPWPFLQ